MRRVLLACVVATFCAVALVGGQHILAKAGAEGDQEVWQFNQKFQDAHGRMDTTAIIGMWSETGVSLLPETAPIVGKADVANL